MFLAFLAFRVEYSIDQMSPSLSLPTYVFQSGGQLLIYFEHPVADAIFVGVCRESEFENLLKVSNLDDELCINRSSVVLLSNVVNIWNAAGEFKCLIDEYGKYQPVLYVCRQSSAKFNIIASFRNPNSFLSADIQPCLYLKPVAILAFGLVFVAWIANWVRNFTLRNALHGALTFAALLNFAQLFVSEFELLHKNHSDEHTILTEVRYAVSSSSQALLLGILLLAARGWRIVQDAVPSIQIISSFCYSILIVLPLLVVELVEDGIASRIACFISIVSIVFYSTRMVSGINRAFSLVLAHLFVISRNGIDATTTPIYTKFSIFKTLLASILVYLGLNSVTMVAAQFFSKGFWPLELITCLNLLFVTWTTMWAFRLAPDRRNDYLMMPQQQDDGNQPELLPCELEGFEPESEALRVGRLAWRDGMRLPRQPIFIDGTRQGRGKARKTVNKVDFEAEEQLSHSTAVNLGVVF
jgi:hypothetical protein